MTSLLPILPSFSLIRLHDGGVGRDFPNFLREQTADLDAASAQRLAALWARLAANPRGGMRCYDPAYEISLWSDGAECFSAAFCWRCCWIRFCHAGKAAPLFAWDSKQPDAVALFNLFDEILPLPKRVRPPEVCPDPLCGHSWEGLPVGGICPGCKLTKTHEPVWHERP